MSETWDVMIERLGVDGLAWANEFKRVCDEGGGSPDMSRWFGYAIKAGQKAGPARPGIRRRAGQEASSS